MLHRAKEQLLDVPLALIILAVTEKGRTISVVKDIGAPQLLEETTRALESLLALEDLLLTIREVYLK